MVPLHVAAMMVVVIDKLVDNMIQMRFSEDDELVQGTSINWWATTNRSSWILLNHID